MIFDQLDIRFSTNFVMGNHVSIDLLLLNMLLSAIKVEKLCLRDTSQIGMGVIIMRNHVLCNLSYAIKKIPLKLI
jgi:hypothetical protein